MHFLIVYITKSVIDTYKFQVFTLLKYLLCQIKHKTLTDIATILPAGAALLNLSILDAALDNEDLND